MGLETDPNWDAYNEVVAGLDLARERRDELDSAVIAIARAERMFTLTHLVLGVAEDARDGGVAERVRLTVE